MFNKRERKTKTIKIEENEDKKEKNFNNSLNKEESLFEQKFLNKKTQFSTICNTNSNEKNILNDFRYKSIYTLTSSNDATRELEINTEKDKDATAIRERNIQISNDKLSGKIKDHEYLGKNSSIIYVDKSEHDLSRYKITGSLGPMRAPTNIRTSCRFDYSYGICKDYKETGYCGFGDSCVFMHDRSDYKTGWELEEEWRKDQRQKSKIIQSEESDSDNLSFSDNDDCLIPLICQICQKNFNSPVVTKCQHYFCEKCAMNHYAKFSSCFFCKKPTDGIFNNADKIINRVLERRNLKKRKSVDKISNINNSTFKNEYNGEKNNPINNNSSTDFKSLDFEEDYGFNDNKKSKNKFKTQHGDEFLSDYKQYV